MNKHNPMSFSQYLAQHAEMYASESEIRRMYDEYLRDFV